MGACGCGDFDNVRWAVTVGPFVLAASDYDGCNNGCAAPLGFNLHLMTPEEAARWQIEPTGEWTPGAHGFDTQYLNLFGQDELAEAAKGLAVDLEEYESLADVLADHGLDLMRAAWKRTRAREDELRKHLIGEVTAPLDVRKAAERIAERLRSELLLLPNEAVVSVKYIADELSALMEGK